MVCKATGKIGLIYTSRVSESRNVFELVVSKKIQPPLM